MLNSLPEKQRTALQLREIDGRSYEEVAEVMQITEADVKVTLHRALKALKVALEVDLHHFYSSGSFSSTLTKHSLTWTTYILNN